MDHVLTSARNFRGRYPTVRLRFCGAPNRKQSWFYEANMQIAVWTSKVFGSGLRPLHSFCPEPLPEVVKNDL
jgi:hypothetical protein